MKVGENIHTALCISDAVFPVKPYGSSAAVLLEERFLAEQMLNTGCRVVWKSGRAAKGFSVELETVGTSVETEL